MATVSPPPAIRTERLRLRPMAEAHAADLARFAADERVAPHLETQLGGDDLIHLAVEARDGGPLLGAVRLSVHRAFEHGELGYWIDPAQWGRGYATEAAAGLLAWAFGPGGLHRVQAHCLVENAGSRRVLEKLGLSQEGVFRGFAKIDGAFRDVVYYALLRPEHEAIRDGQVGT